jgi:hypothetical protein
VKKIILFLLAITLTFLSGCSASGGAKGTIPTKEFVANITSGSVDTAYYVFREKSFGGSLFHVSVVCNDELFNLAVGEFMECQPWAPINYLGIDIDEESGDLSSVAIGDAAGLISGDVATGLIAGTAAEVAVIFSRMHKYDSNFLSKDSNLIYRNKLEGNRFVFTKNGEYSVKNLISKKQALELIEKGYNLVKAPEATSPIFRYTATLNPYSSVDYGFFTPKAGELPHMLLENADLSSFTKGKQGVVIYTDSDVKYPAGIWFKDKYIGSLIGPSYIFVETVSKDETLYTYIRGTLQNITFAVRENQITYIKLNTKFYSMSGSLGSRSFSPSNEKQFMGHYEYLNRLELNKSADISPSITEIELEGINILNELVGFR